jgi:hypothetical protein
MHLHSNIGLEFHSNPGSALLLEIDGLRALESQMSRNLEALRRGRDELEYRKTWKGRIWIVFGKIFALYCVVRIISVRHLQLHCKSRLIYNSRYGMSYLDQAWTRRQHPPPISSPTLSHDLLPYFPQSRSLRMMSPHLPGRSAYS